jgi:hypothetical protein
MNAEKKKMTQLFDDKGKPIKDVTAIVCYDGGIVVGTPKGLYTNVESLLKTWKNKS